MDESMKNKGYIYFWFNRLRSPQARDDHIDALTNTGHAMQRDNEMTD